MDTTLSDILVFKFFRAETITGTLMPPSIVVTFNIVKHRCAHYNPANKSFSVDTFHLQRMEETFRAGIVITVAFHTHAASQIMLLQQESLLSQWERDPAVAIIPFVVMLYFTDFFSTHCKSGFEGIFWLCHKKLHFTQLGI